METIPNQGQELHAEALAKWLFAQGKDHLIIVMGLPASGKTTLCEALDKLGAKRINRDAIRKRLYGNEGIYGDYKVVNREYYAELKAALQLGGPVVSDNVNLTINHRKGTLEEAAEFGYTNVTVVWLNVPLDVCLARNAARERHVTENVMISMDNDLRKDGEPRESEGGLVILASGKDKDHYVIEKIRKSAPKAPALRTASAIEADRRQLSADLRVQFTLFDACFAAGRDPWAAETLAVIRKLSDEGIALFGEMAPSAAPAKPKAPAAGKKPWVPPTPAQVRETLLKMIGERPLVSGTGPLVALSFNGHLLTKEKAELLIDPLSELFKRAHIIFVQESNVEALRFIAKTLHYGLIASHRNVREQACGILFHPRLHWLGDKPVYHDYLLDVPGHPEFKASLRPAIQRRVRDLATGFVLDLVDLHAKSNLGGPDATRPIRRWSYEALVKELERQKEKSPYAPRKVARTVPARSTTTGAATFPDDSGSQLPLGAILIGGDYNAPIENPETTEIEPLINAGFVRISTPDLRWSYQYRGNGGQFDGFFGRGLENRVLECFIPLFFPAENKRDNAFYRELSDHLPVFAVIDTTVAAAPAQAPAPVAAEVPAEGAAPAAPVPAEAPATT